MPGYSGRGRGGQGHIPEAPLTSVVIMGVVALLLLAYAAWLAKGNGWNSVVRNYVIAAVLLIGVTVLYAVDRL